MVTSAPGTQKRKATSSQPPPNGMTCWLLNVGLTAVAPLLLPLRFVGSGMAGVLLPVALARLSLPTGAITALSAHC
jgi:hypothetical protein